MEKKNLLFTMAFAAMCASASAYAPAASMSAKAPSAFSGKAKVKPEEVKNDRIAHWELAGEVAPNANDLNGKLLVIGSADGASIIVGCDVNGKHPGGPQDLFTVKVADFDADYKTYAKFTKVTDAGVEGDNLYTINVCNENGETYNVYGGNGFLNFQPGDNTIIFALGLNNQYGQDGKNLALWQVTAVEGGYNIKNVGNGKYLNPASSNPSADAVAVKLYSKVNYKTYEKYATDIEDEGKYLLKNVETGKYLAPGNSWGTQASLDDHGTFFTFARLENGMYTLSSVATNDQDKNKHYLGENAFCDAAAAEFMIFSTKDGYVLTLNDQVEEPTYFGANANGKTCDFASKERNAATTWQLVTVEDILSDDAVNNADEANPLDLTVLLKDANFGRNNNEGGWDIMPTRGGDNANCNAEKWGGSSDVFDSHQTVKGLPNGRYMIMAQGYYRYNNTTNNTNNIAATAHANGTEVINSFLYANGQEVALKSIADEEAVAIYGKMPFSQGEASAAFNMGLYDNVLYNVEVTDETLTLGVKKTSHPGCDWTVWDNFRIYYLGAKDPMRIEEIAVEKQEVDTDDEGNTVVEDGNAKLIVEFNTVKDGNEVIVFGSAFLQDNGAEIPATNGYVRDAKGLTTGDKISSNIAQMNSFSIPVPISGEGKFTAVLPRGFFVYLDADYDWSGTGGVHNVKAKDVARAMAKAAAKGKAGLVQEINVNFTVGANGATSIQGIQGITADGKVFDLSGRATVTGKGIVIKNGKKVLK